MAEEGAAQNQLNNEELKEGENQDIQNEKDEEAKNLAEFKNVSQVLIDLIENPPSI